MPSRADTPRNDPPGPVLWLAWAGVLGVLVAAAGSIGGTIGPVAASAVVLDTLLRSGWPAMVWLVAAWGAGAWFGGPGMAAPLRFCLGVSLLLTAGAVLGMLGLLSTTSATVLMLAASAGGFRVLARGGRGLHTRRTPPGWLWASLPGIALLLTAAANPPGVLWSSEYGGYDVLGYHLELPKEWLALGHTRPVTHNVYAYLPGWIESAFAVLGRLAGGGDLLADGGRRLMSAQFLHAGLTIASGWVVARLARRLAAAAGIRERGIASTVAGGLVICTPWSIVVGSMAYNDMGAVLLGAGAMLAACGCSARPVRRAALVGFLVGAAGCVKPTALFMVGIPAGVVLLRFLSWRHWGRAVAAGSSAGLLAVSPWLIRNGVLTGNPVFPFASGLFGTGHWTAEQAARFASAHTFDGSLIDRVRLLVFPDQAGRTAVARWRGLTNPQWLLALPAGVIGAVLLFDRTRPRRIAVGLLLGLSGQLSAWLLLTHLQSRFLLPVLLTLAPAAGIGLARLKRLGLTVGVVACLLQGAGAWAIFSEQRGGRPAALLPLGPSAMMGEPYSEALGLTSPTAYINHELPRGATVVLVGGATPLYLDRRVRYATVWDRPPVLDVLGSPGVSGDGVYVLLDRAELARQAESGYLDPAITPALIGELVSRCVPVRSWPELGVSLYRLGRGELAE